MEKSEFRVLIKHYFLRKIVFFVSSAERRILTQERVTMRAEVPRVVSAQVVKYVPQVTRTIFYFRCIPIVSRVGIVLRAESFFSAIVR